MQNLTTKSFNQIENRFVELSDRKTFLKEVSFALQIFASNSYLNKATTESKLECVVNLAQTGLTLNPVSKLAYLIPYFSENKVKCRLEPSYQGLIKLVTDTGSAKTVYAHAVYEGDEFKTTLGTSINIIHEPKFEKGAKVTHVYAVAILNDGTMQVEVMTSEQVVSIMEGSESYKAYKDPNKPYVTSCIWLDHFQEMAKKTVVKRLVKYLPKTDLFEKLGTAIELDNQDFKATHNQLDYIDSLIMTSAIDPDELDSIEREKGSMNADRAAELIQYLKDNQRDPIASGDNYSQTDIKNKLSSEN